MKVDQPNAEQKKWREQVRDLGCVVCGSENPEIHHVVGRTSKHNKVHIGHWFILPLNHFNHKYLDQGSSGLEILKSEARQMYNVDNINDMGNYEFQKWLFGRVLRRIPDRPFGDEVIQAISEWHR